MAAFDFFKQKKKEEEQAPVINTSSSFTLPKANTQQTSAARNRAAANSVSDLRASQRDAQRQRTTMQKASYERDYADSLVSNFKAMQANKWNRGDWDPVAYTNAYKTLRSYLQENSNGVNKKSYQSMIKSLDKQRYAFMPETKQIDERRNHQRLDPTITEDRGMVTTTPGSTNPKRYQGALNRMKRQVQTYNPAQPFEQQGMYNNKPVNVPSLMDRYQAWGIGLGNSPDPENPSVMDKMTYGDLKRKKAQFEYYNENTPKSFNTGYAPDRAVAESKTNAPGRNDAVNYSGNINLSEYLNSDQINNYRDYAQQNDSEEAKRQYLRNNTDLADAVIDQIVTADTQQLGPQRSGVTAQGYTTEQESPLRSDNLFSNAIYQIDQELKDRNFQRRYAALYMEPDFEENSQFNVQHSILSRDIPDARNTVVGHRPVEMTEDQMDRLFYAAVNGNQKAIDYLGNIQLPDGPEKSRYDYVVQQYMNEDEVAMFNYLYNTPGYGKDSAMEYFSGLEPTLNARNAQAQQEYYNELMKDPAKAIEYNIIGILKKPFGDVASLITQWADLETTGRIDPNAGKYLSMNDTQTIRNATYKAITESTGSEFLGDLYNTGTSVADNLYGQALGASMSKILGITGSASSAVQEGFTLGIMSTGSAQQTVLTNIQNGMSEDDAVVLGYTAGIIEYATEKIGLDNLFNSLWTGKSAFTSMFTQMLSEGAEEGLSDVLNWSAGAVYDQMMGRGVSDWRREMNAYILENGLAPSDEGKAFAAIMSNKLSELGMDVLMGGVSAVPMSASGIARGYAGRGSALNNTIKDLTSADTYDADAIRALTETATRGPQVNTSDDQRSEQRDLRNKDQMTAVQRLGQLAQEGQRQTKAQRLAQAVQNKLDNDEQLTDKDLRPMLNAFYNEGLIDAYGNPVKPSAQFMMEDMGIDLTSYNDTRSAAEKALGTEFFNQAAKGAMEMNAGITDAEARAAVEEDYNRAVTEARQAVQNKRVRNFVNGAIERIISNNTDVDPDEIRRRINNFVEGGEELATLQDLNVSQYDLAALTQIMEGSLASTEAAQTEENQMVIPDNIRQAIRDRASTPPLARANRSVGLGQQTGFNNRLVEDVADNFDRAGSIAMGTAIRSFNPTGMSSAQYAGEMSDVYYAVIEGNDVPETPHLTPRMRQAAINAAEMDLLQNNRETEQNQPNYRTGYNNLDEELQAEAQNMRLDQEPEPAAAPGEYVPIDKTEAQTESDLETIQNYASEANDQGAQNFADTVYDTYADDMDVDSFVAGADSIYQQVQQGKALDEVQVPETSRQYISDETKARIYDAASNDITEGAQYNGTTEEQGNVFIPGSSQRNDSTGAAVQTAGMAAGAGPTEISGRNTAETGRSESGNGYHLTGQKVTARSLGITNGTDTNSVELVDIDSSTRDGKLIKALGKKYNVKVVGFVGGNLSFADQADPARGVYHNGTIYVRMDDPQFSGFQIAKHEAGHHLLVANKNHKINQVFSQMRQTFGDSFVDDKLMPAYREALARSGYTDLEVMEEILCDIFGGMNMQEDVLRNLPAMAELYDSFMNEGGKISYSILNQNDTAEAVDEVRDNGPPKMTLAQDKNRRGIIQFAKNIINGIRNTEKNYDLGTTASGEFAFDISKIVGFNVDGFKMVLDHNAIIHSDREHGEHGRSDHTMADVNEYGYVAMIEDTYTSITPARKNSGEHKNSDNSPAKQVVVSVPKGNGAYYVVEAVPDNASRTIHVTSVYQTKNAMGQVPHAQKALGFTSDNELESPIASNDYIPQNQTAGNPKRSLSFKNTMANGSANRQTSIATQTQEDAVEDLKARVNELRAENAKSLARAEYFKGQTRQSAHTTGSRAWQDTKSIITEATARKIAKALINLTGANVNADDLIADIQYWGTYLATKRGGDNTFDDVNRGILPIAKLLVENAQDTSEWDGSEILKDIRNTTIKISPKVAADIGDFNEWRKAHFGKMRVSFNTGQDITEYYDQLRDQWGPSVFPEENMTASDQLVFLADFVDNFQPATQNPFSYDMAAAVQDIALQVYDELLNADVMKPTFADRSRASMDKLKAESQERIEQFKWAARDNRDKQIQRIKDYYRQNAEHRRERISDMNLRREIMKRGKRLQSMRTTRANQALIKSVLGDMNFDVQQMTSGRAEKLENLQAWCNEQEKNNPDFFMSEYVKDQLAQLNQDYLNDIIRKGDKDAIDRLIQLNEAMKELEHMIRNQHALINSNDKRDSREQSAEALRNVDNSQGTKKGFWRDFDSLIVQGTLSPMRFIHRLTGYVDSDPVYRACKGISDGQLKKLQYKMNANKEFEQWLSDKKFMKNITGSKADIKTYDLTTADGKKAQVQLTPAMRMTLYLASKDSGWMRHMCGVSTPNGHMDGGGITLPDMKFYKKGNMKHAYDGTQTVKITKRFLNQLSMEMTEKERAFADAAHDFFATTQKNAINKVSEARLGRALATVDDYLPISVDKNFLGAEYGALKYDGTAEGIGALKERVTSSTPVIVRDLTDILMQSIESTSTYVGLAIPIYNFNKLMGVTIGHLEADGTYRNYEQSLLKSINTKWGSTAQKYIEKMITDMQNPNYAREDLEKAFAKLRSRYAGAVLTLNASVALKQAASYPTAAGILGWKPLLQAFKNPGHVDLDLIAKYTPLQWYRTQGFSTAELGDIKNQNNIFANLPKGLNWIQGMDILTTRKLWKAAEYYVQEHNPELYKKGAGVKGQSDAYYKAVAEIYNQVITETQPNYTPWERPQYLRSHSGVVQTLMMFKTQPMQNFNVLYDAIGNYKGKKAQLANDSTNAEAQAQFKEAKTKLTRAITSQIAALVTFAAMTMLWNMFRRKKEKYEDEDGNFSLGVVAENMGKDMASSVMGMLPFGSDAYSLISSLAFGDTYYGFESVTDSALGDLGNAVKTAWDLSGELVNAIRDGEPLDFTEQKKRIKSVVSASSKVLGIPYDNLYNTVTALYKRKNDIFMDEHLADYYALAWDEDPSKKKSDISAILYDAYDDPEIYQQLYQILLDSGEWGTDKLTPEQDIEAYLKKRYAEDVSGGTADQGVYKYLMSLEGTADYQKALTKAAAFGYEGENLDKGLKKAFAADMIGADISEYNADMLYDYLSKLNSTERDKAYKDLIAHGFSEDDLDSGSRNAYGAGVVGVSAEDYSSNMLYEKLNGLTGEEYQKLHDDLLANGYDEEDITAGRKKAYGISLTGEAPADYSQADLYDQLYSLKLSNESAYNTEIENMLATGFTNDDIDSGIRDAYGRKLTGVTKNYSNNDLYTYVYEENDLAARVTDMKEKGGFSQDQIQNGLKQAYAADVTGGTYGSVKMDEVYEYIYNLYTSNKDKFKSEYQRMVDVGFKEDAIKKGIEGLMKQAEGVDNVRKLSKRFEAPTITMPDWWSNKADVEGDSSSSGTEAEAGQDKGSAMSFFDEKKDENTSSGSVSSSWLSNYSYNKKTGEFRVYDYSKGVWYTRTINEATFNAWLNSESKGSYFRKYIY